MAWQNLLPDHSPFCNIAGSPAKAGLAQFSAIGLYLTIGAMSLMQQTSRFASDADHHPPTPLSIGQQKASDGDRRCDGETKKASRDAGGAVRLDRGPRGHDGFLA
jgi:hypothetical protein